MKSSTFFVKAIVLALVLISYSYFTPFFAQHCNDVSSGHNAGFDCATTAITTTVDRPNPVPFDFAAFLGLNARREDPIHRMKCVGFLREYHEWSIDENVGICNGNNPPDCYGKSYPENEYHWNPASSNTTITSFDDFYQEIRAQGLDICATMIRSNACLINLECGEGAAPWDIQLEAKPVAPDASTINPLSYVWHADWLTQFIYRYGQPENNTVIPEKLTFGQQRANNLTRGSITYLENWNEQDNFWDCAQGIPAYFSPAEYAAMSSMDYDGHGNSFRAQDKYGNTYPVGIRNIDPSVKLVMGGLSGLDACYLTELVDEIKALRSDQVFPFDVINFHRYSNLYKKLFNPNNPDYTNHGVQEFLELALSPEADGLRDKQKQIDLLRDNHPDLIGKELWLSEFGYDVVPNSPQAALGDVAIDPPILLPNPNTTGDCNCNAVPDYEDNNVICKPYQTGYITHLRKDFRLIRDYYFCLPTKDQERLKKLTAGFQAQWLARSFLEIAAADFDKAQQFCIRDFSPNANGLFLSSGLIRSSAENFAPKKAWYYVYTLKNLLAGHDFEVDESNLYQQTPELADTLCTSNNPRVYRYKQTNDQSDTWVVWSPTVCNKSAYEIDLNIGNAALAKLVKMVAPATAGIEIALTPVADGNGNFFVTIPVSETPVFVVLGETAEPIKECILNVESPTQYCNGVQLRWEELPSDIDQYQIWYGKTANITPDLSNTLFADATELTLYDDEIPVSSTNLVITSESILPETAYTFFIYGMNEKGNITNVCSLDITTGTNNSFCKINMSEAIESVTDGNGLPIEVTSGDYHRLFDQQNITDCALPAYDSQLHYEIYGNNGRNERIITLNENYNIYSIALLDGQGEGIFTIIGIEPSGREHVLFSQETPRYNAWVFESDLFPSEQLPAIKQLKIIKPVGQDVKVGELIFCGEKENITETGAPCPVETLYQDRRNTSCRAVVLKWPAPTAYCYSSNTAKAKSYIFSVYGPGGGVLPNYDSYHYYFNASTAAAVIGGLEPGTSYRVAIVAINDEGISSEERSFRFVTKASGEWDCNDSISGRSQNSQEYFLNVGRIKLHPNPAADFIHINTPDMGFHSLEVRSLQGRLIRSANFETVKTYRLDIRDLPQGVYLIRVRFVNGKNISEKFVKAD